MPAHKGDILPVGMLGANWSAEACACVGHKGTLCKRRCVDWMRTHREAVGS